MSLEDAIKENTAAVKELNATLKAGGGASTGATSGKAGGKPAAAAAPKSKRTADEVKAKVLEVKEQIGMPKAKEVITGTGASDLADLLNKPALWDKAFDAATEALAADPAEEDENDGL